MMVAPMILYTHTRAHKHTHSCMSQTENFAGQRSIQYYSISQLIHNKVLFPQPVNITGRASIRSFLACCETSSFLYHNHRFFAPILVESWKQENGAPDPRGGRKFCLLRHFENFVVGICIVSSNRFIQIKQHVCINASFSP